MSIADSSTASITKSYLAGSRMSLPRIVLASSLAGAAGLAAIATYGLVLWIALDLLGY